MVSFVRMLPQGSDCELVVGARSRGSGRGLLAKAPLKTPRNHRLLGKEIPGTIEAYRLLGKDPLEVTGTIEAHRLFGKTWLKTHWALGKDPLEPC